MSTEPRVGLLRVEEALERVLEGVAPLAGELVELTEAAGRVLAAPVVATTALPPWDNSAMDGFAVRAVDLLGATPAQPVRLRVVGEVAAGHVPPRAVDPGTALRITTGAILPAGADTVVPVEETDAPAGVAELPARVAVQVAAPSGANVRRAGEDVQSGATVLERGRLLGPAAVALAAASGAAHVLVHRRPRVGILATGDELTPTGQPLGPGRIYDSNTPALVVQARAAGALTRSFGIAPDDPQLLTERLAAAVAWADVVVLSGGVSVGAHDHVRDAFAALGEVAFWRVAMQPGKPLAFGRTRAGRAGDRADPERPVALFGLPGNPVSTFVTFELFVRPFVRALAGRPAASDRRRVRAVLGEAVTKSPGRRAFLRVRLETDPAGSGQLLAWRAGGQGSHVLSALAAADGLAVIPEDVPGLPAGAPVEVWQLEDEGR
jgi:molybdopterin molybdotransferase